MVVRCLFLCIVLIAANVSPVAIADGPSGKQGYRTIEELFSAYRKATEDRDWKSLFLLGTRERQDSDILMLIVSAATSNDGTLKFFVGTTHGSFSTDTNPILVILGIDDSGNHRHRNGL